MCDMTHLGVACFISMCDMTHSNVWYDSFICVTWLIHMCAMTHSYVCHDLFICVKWNRVNKSHVRKSLIRPMAHTFVWHDSFLCVTCLISMCAMTYLYVCHKSFTWNRDNKSHVRESSYTFLTLFLHFSYACASSLLFFFFPFSPTHTRRYSKQTAIRDFILEDSRWDESSHTFHMNAHHHFVLSLFIFLFFTHTRRYSTQTAIRIFIFPSQSQLIFFENQLSFLRSPAIPADLAGTRISKLPRTGRGLNAEIHILMILTQQTPVREESASRSEWVGACCWRARWPRMASILVLYGVLLRCWCYMACSSSRSPPH